MLEKITRRNFIRIAGLGGAGLATGLGTNGCAAFPKDVNWASVPDSEFSLEKFDDWFTWHKLYNGINPNLKMGHAGYSPTFNGSFRQGFTPGRDYNSNFMYASADGIVSSINEIGRPGSLGGLVIYISHGNDTHGVTFKTLYNHLSQTYVKLNDFVQVGDKLGSVMDANHAKLILWKRFNFVDPENYGINHSFMKYNGQSKNENIEEKHIRQLQICAEISNNCSIELDLNRKHTTLRVCAQIT